jgi:succinate-acetate transporter protein
MMKLANPAPLGLFGFAVTTIMLSLFNVKIFGPVDTFPLLMCTAFAFGGTAQFLAGLMEYPRGNTFGLVAFCSYGAFWWAFALLISGVLGKISLAVLGAWLVVWALFTFAMWLATLKVGTMVLQLVFLTLWIAFLLLGLSHLLNMDILHTIGGWIGFLCGALAFYLAAAEVLNEVHGKTVLPIGAKEIV